MEFIIVGPKSLLTKLYKFSELLTERVTQRLSVVFDITEPSRITDAIYKTLLRLIPKYLFSDTTERFSIVLRYGVKRIEKSAYFLLIELRIGSTNSQIRIDNILQLSEHFKSIISSSIKIIRGENVDNDALSMLDELIGYLSNLINCSESKLYKIVSEIKEREIMLEYKGIIRILKAILKFLLSQREILWLEEISIESVSQFIDEKKYSRSRARGKSFSVLTQVPQLH